MRFDDIKIGQMDFLEKKITFEDVKLFANLSLDNNPIHLDADYALKSFFKQRIVPGLLVASLISGVLGNKLPGEGSIYLKQELRFLKPVYLNEMIRAECNVIELIDEKKIVRLNTACLRNNGEIVIDGYAVMKLFN